MGHSFFSAVLLLLWVYEYVPFILSTDQDYLHETMLEWVRPILAEDNVAL